MLHIGLFPFLAHPSVFRFFDAVLFTCPSFFVVFLFVFPTCSHPLLARPFLDTIEPAGLNRARPARPVNGGGVPSVPELSLVFVSLRPLGGLPHLCLLRVFSCSFSGYLPLFHAVFAHVLCLPFVLSETLFVIFSLCWVADFSSIIAPATLFRTAFVFVSRFPAFT